MTTPKQKPYISKTGRDWVVLDSTGAPTFRTEDKAEAVAFLASNYHWLDR